MYALGMIDHVHVDRLSNQTCLQPWPRNLVGRGGNLVQQTNKSCYITKKKKNIINTLKYKFAQKWRGYIPAPY